MQTDSGHLQKGYLLQEFEIKALLGQGGFGVTYLAYDESFETNVVLKEYYPTGFAVRQSVSTVVPASENAKENFVWGLSGFQQEARTLAKFKHKNIITVKRVFPANGTAYMVMDYLEGGSLEDRLKQGLMSEQELRPILDQIIDGLKLVHAEKFLHRDIAPDNIMFTDKGVPVLIDFGAARMAIGSKSKPLSAIVKEGYAPIEQYNEKSKQGPYTDIYALSAVCYEIIAGKRPYEATVRIAADQDPLENLAGQVTGWSDGLLQAVDAGLKIRSKDRPQSLEEWQAILDGPDNITDPVDNEPEKVISPPRKEAVAEPDVAKGATNLPRETYWKKIAIVLVVAVMAWQGFTVYQENEEEDYLAYNRAIRQNTEAGYARYKREYPKGNYISEIQRRYDQIRADKRLNLEAWNWAKKMNTAASYKGYMDLYPKGPYFAQAEKLYNDLIELDDWNTATTANSIASYKHYMNMYPSGMYYMQAKGFHDQLVKNQALAGKQTDDEVWKKAYAAKTVEAYQKYIRLYPKGKKADWAYYFIGGNYYNGKNGVQKDYKLAFRNYEISARMGDGDAMVMVGKFYYHGYSVAVDYVKAKEWFIKGAGKGKKHAMAWMGVLYNKGLSVQKNEETALSWYEKSKKAGATDYDKEIKGLKVIVGEKYYKLARGQRYGASPNYRLAMQNYRKAAGYGHLKAMSGIGDLYDGGHGITKNRSTAVSWYRKAADAGDKGALFTMGLHYQGGFGVTQDLKVALVWMRKAADAGHASAMNSIGKFYEGGWGVPKNMYLARQWYEKARKAGYK